MYLLGYRSEGCPEERNEEARVRKSLLPSGITEEEILGLLFKGSSPVDSSRFFFFFSVHLLVSQPKKNLRPETVGRDLIEPKVSLLFYPCILSGDVDESRRNNIIPGIT